MVDVVEKQPLANRLDSVDSGIAEEPDSASSVSPSWCPMFSPISSSMADCGDETPFFVGGENGSCTSAEKVREVAFELARDLVLYATGKTAKPANRYCNTLRRLCHELSTKHQILFTSLVKKLNLRDDDLDCQFLENVADRMFADRQYNWGRIVTFYSFAGWLARHFVDNRMNPLWPERIADKTGKLIAEKAGFWIMNNGGWDTMNEFFKEPDNLESKMWKGLLYTVLGLGVLATTVAVVR